MSQLASSADTAEPVRPDCRTDRCELGRQTSRCQSHEMRTQPACLACTHCVGGRRSLQTFRVTKATELATRLLQSSRVSSQWHHRTPCDERTGGRRASAIQECTNRTVGAPTVLCTHKRAHDQRRGCVMAREAVMRVDEATCTSGMKRLMGCVRWSPKRSERRRNTTPHTHTTRTTRPSCSVRATCLQRHRHVPLYRVNHYALPPSSRWPHRVASACCSQSRSSSSSPPHAAVRATSRSPIHPKSVMRRATSFHHRISHSHSYSQTTPHDTQAERRHRTRCAVSHHGQCSPPSYVRHRAWWLIRYVSITKVNGVEQSFVSDFYMLTTW
jgi:hypothetical protein